MKKKLLFVENLDPYQFDVLVMVGFTASDKKEFMKQMKKYRIDFAAAKIFLEKYDEIIEGLKKNLGQFMWIQDEKDHMMYILSLRAYEDTWKYWEILMHEVHHLVRELADTKGFLKEPEAQAYLFENLFRSIRRKLQGIDKL